MQVFSFRRSQRSVHRQLLVFWESALIRMQQQQQKQQKGSFSAITIHKSSTYGAADVLTGTVVELKPGSSNGH